MGTAEDKDAPPVVDYGDAPVIVCMDIGEPTRLPGDMYEFPVYRFTKDSEGRMIRRLVASLVFPIPAMTRGVLLASEALARVGVPVLSERDMLIPLN